MIGKNLELPWRSRNLKASLRRAPLSVAIISHNSIHYCNPVGTIATIDVSDNHNCVVSCSPTAINATTVVYSNLDYTVIDLDTHIAVTAAVVISSFTVPLAFSWLLSVPSRCQKHPPASF